MKKGVIIYHSNIQKLYKKRWSVEIFFKLLKKNFKFERLNEYNKLKNNIPEGNLFENSAISDYDGSIEMLTIDQSAIDKGLVHSCFYGMSAVYPPKNGLGSEPDRPTVEKYGKLTQVNCVTFETLLSKHNIENFDVVKIDAEGHDYKIFKQINLEKYRPKIVRLEWINLSEEEQEEIKFQFEKHNYVVELTGQDIVGLPKEFHDELFQPKTNNKEKITFVAHPGYFNRSLFVNFQKKYIKTILT